ncbi:hypothetical protein M9458_052167 [Cirrhinus mrigala]|uniref:Uncharacterized protein n=1 Tax=Cirrhinus mrigala TaxID=683832 RepID=A0ABD0MQX5_CIRMR
MNNIRVIKNNNFRVTFLALLSENQLSWTKREDEKMKSFYRRPIGSGSLRSLKKIEPMLCDRISGHTAEVIRKRLQKLGWSPSAPMSSKPITDSIRDQVPRYWAKVYATLRCSQQRWELAKGDLKWGIIAPLTPMEVTEVLHMMRQSAIYVDNW